MNEHGDRPRPVGKVWDARKSSHICSGANPRDRMARTRVTPVRYVIPDGAHPTAHLGRLGPCHVDPGSTMSGDVEVPFRPIKQAEAKGQSAVPQGFLILRILDDGNDAVHGACLARFVRDVLLVFFDPGLPTLMTCQSLPSQFGMDDSEDLGHTIATFDEVVVEAHQVLAVTVVRPEVMDRR